MESKLLHDDDASFLSEPWVWIDTEVKDDCECHCLGKHPECFKLVKKRGRCLCEQFVLLNCESQVALSEQSWKDILSPMVEGVCHRFWGYGSFYGTVLRKYFVYTVVIRVENAHDRNRILTLIDESLINDLYIPGGYSRLDLSGNESCCVQDFLGFSVGGRKQKVLILHLET